MGFRAIFLRDLRLLYFDRVNLIFALLTPLVYMLLYATSIASLVGDVPFHGEGVPYGTYMVGGILTITAMSAGAQVANSVFSEVSSGSGLEIWSSPVSTGGYLGGRFAAICLFVTSQLVVMLTVGLVVTGYRAAPVEVLLAIASGILGALVIGGMLMFVGFFVSSPNRFMMVLNIFQTVAIFAAPVFYDLESMPTVLRWVAAINPLTYIVELTRSVLFSSWATSTSIALAVSGAAFLTFIALDAARLVAIRRRL